MSVCKVKCGCLIAITFFSLIYGMDNKETTTEADFNDVLVNISKVNGMIQDLIQNYKQLQKMTNSDISQSDYDEKKMKLSHEELKDYTKNRAVRKDKPTRTTKQRSFSTVMIMSDEERGKSKDERVKEKARKPKDKRNSKTGHVNDDNVEKTKVDSVYNPVTPEAATQTFENTKSTFKKDGTAISKALQNEKVSGDDSVIKPRSKPANVVTLSIPKYVLTITTMYPKIIGNLIEKRQSTPSKKHLEPRLDYDGPPEIRKHIRRIKKKPEIIYLRSNKKTKQESTPRSITKKKQTKDSESEWEGADKVLKEEKRITVLRQAYGDACLRLVLRKCYRACKEVSRDICYGNRLCPKTFMAAFKRTALNGCDKEFRHNASVYLRANPTDLKKGDFVDPTREGYLAMACLPGERPKTIPRQKHVKTNIKPQRRNKKHVIALAKTDHLTNPGTSLLVLRDRYEEACSRESAKKCYRACRNAINAAIEAAIESKKPKRKDSMIKACKKRCSKAYRAKGYYDSRSETDDSDDSSSDSGSNEKKKKKSGSW